MDVHIYHRMNICLHIFSKIFLYREILRRFFIRIFRILIYSEDSVCLRGREGGGGIVEIEREMKTKICNTHQKSTTGAHIYLFISFQNLQSIFHMNGAI